MPNENNKTNISGSPSPLQKNGGITIWKVLVPVIIGLTVVVWLFHREFNVQVWDSIHFDTRVVACILLAWLFMAGRDFGLTWRFRSLTDRDITWWQAIKVNFMCEFTSAVTPSAVGGSSLGMIFLHHEGIALGRATTLMMTTLFLDELFFVVSCPVIVAIIPYDELFGFSHTKFEMGLKWVFWIVYAVLFAWTLILFCGIILKPNGVRKALVWLFGFRILRRWQPDIVSLGDSMVATARSLRTRSWKWWGEVFGATALTWTSRYLVVNALFLGFVPAADQLVVFGRQFVVWVVLMVSPTPGGSGVSEWLFTEYYGDMLHNTSVALIIALFWRIITYYVYLIVGVFLAPSMLSSRTARPVVDDPMIPADSVTGSGEKTDGLHSDN
ncbi:lysylphosphatidylglycerol synthase transmembrane domain-containing protein [uncultured Muribaculum sp.]|uniref:lysylphosphatidylglycerol synthase transmembrane domain-containing protein n=1 Tax=uncultured Muribaculum sp. TaxID=1918613 RepID=UPI0025F93153|nr:lysylphosphatidylglycerol synthase transmembrane domain-containing protein [uncultured Muribaculum sp.]